MRDADLQALVERLVGRVEYLGQALVRLEAALDAADETIDRLRHLHGDESMRCAHCSQHFLTAPPRCLDDQHHEWKDETP